MQAISSLLLELKQLRIAEWSLVALWISVSVNFVLALFAVAGEQIRGLIWKPRLRVAFGCSPEFVRSTSIVRSVPTTTSERHPQVQSRAYKAVYSLLKVENHGRVAATNVAVFVEYAIRLDLRERPTSPLSEFRLSEADVDDLKRNPAVCSWIGHKLNWAFGAGQSDDPGSLSRIAARESALLDFVRAESGVLSHSTDQLLNANYKLYTTFQSRAGLESLASSPHLVALRVSCDQVAPRAFFAIAHLPSQVFASWAWSKTRGNAMLPDFEVLKGLDSIGLSLSSLRARVANPEVPKEGANGSAASD